MTAVDPIRRNNVTVTGNTAASSTLVFLHGFASDQRSWKAVAAPFMSDHRIVLFDHVGAGRSDPAAFVQHHYLNLQGYVRDFLDICRALNLHNAIAVGHSVGGMIALLAAVAEPRHFSRLVMIGASPRYLDEPGYHGGLSDADFNQVYDSISSQFTQWADAYAPAVMCNADRPQFALDFASAIKLIPKDRVLTVLCSILQSDHRADIDKLKIPALLIHTRSDPAVPVDVAEYLHRHIQGSQLAFIDAEGHFPHLVAPQKVVEVLRPFLAAAQRP